MNKTVRKNSIREILKAPGRFLAILGIIMLGAGFFSGLRGTRDALIKTADLYLKNTAFYDLELISTVGYTEDAVAEIRKTEGVIAAEGCLKQDALVQMPADDDAVISFYTLPREVNLPEIRQGRQPQSPDEILLDLNASGSFHIGDELELSTFNSQQTKDMFKETVFTVTGFATSPLYLNYERGSTSIGTGSVSSIAYILPEALDADYYSSIYVRVDSEGELYSQEYEDSVERYRSGITEASEWAAHTRFQKLMGENRETLEDAETEYADGLKEFKEKRAEAKQEFADARSQLDDALAELTDGRKQYRKGVKKLEKEKENAQKQFEEAEKELDEGARKLADGEKEYGEGLADYRAGEAQYAASISSYNTLSQVYSVVFRLSSLYADFKSASLDTVQVLTKVMEDISKLSFDPDMTPEERAEKIREIYSEHEGELMTSLKEATARASTLADEIEKAYGPSAALTQFREQINAMNALIEEGNLLKEDTEDAVTRLFQSASALSEAASEVMNELSGRMAGANQELENARIQLQNARAQLDAAQAVLAASREELDQGWDEYFAGVEELKEAKEEAEKAFAEAEEELKEAEKELEEGQKAYDEGMADYRTAWQEAETEIREAEDQLKDARKQLDRGWKTLEEQEEPNVIVLDRNTNIGYICLDNDSSIVQKISKVFPVFFFMVAALICMTTIARMTDEQRGQTGVLMSLGYGRGAISAKYLSYAGTAAFLGCGIGIPLFSWFFPNMIWYAYRIMYHYAEKLEFSLDWKLYLITTVGYTIAMMLVAWLSLRTQLKTVPAVLLRPKQPKIGKRVLLERVPFIWKHLSFMWKVTMRNIFRYRVRVFMMLLGVAGCTALMVTGFGIKDSISDIVVYQYEEITHYEYEVRFLDPVDPEAQARFRKTASRYSGDTAFVMSQNVSLKHHKKEGSVNLVTVEDDVDFSAFVSFKKGQHELAFPKTGEAVINNALAEDLDLKAGDEAVMRIDENEYTVKISAVFDNYIYNYLYMSDATYSLLTGQEPEKNTALVLKRPEVPDATARLLNQENVVNVTAGSLLKDRIGSIMDNLIYIVLLTIICAALLAFIVIYNLININITERMREIATVKVLGFYPEEAAVYVLRENILLTLLGALLGVPLGIWLNRFVMSAIKVDLISFTARVRIPSFFYAIGLTFLFSLMVYAVMMRKLKKIDIAAALKAAE